MRRLRNSFLVISLFGSLCVGSGFAQSAEELESPAVNRVAEKLLCPCGCKMNMACRMEPYPCQTCWANKKKILKLQAAGLSDQAILDQFAQEQGKEIVSNPPGVLGSLSMYSAAFIGLTLVVWLIRRYSRKEALAAGAGTPTNDPELARYHDQIEKEVEKLD
jgi:cytochrome c-type biogenesis protein CcmH/NrfF